MRKALLVLLCVAPALALESRASQIFTPQIAQSVLGTNLKAQDPRPDVVIGQTWVSNAGYVETGGQRSAHILIRHAGTVAEARNIFDSSRKTFHGHPIAGLGDAAYRTDQPAQLDVLKGANWLIVSVGTYKHPEPEGQVKLARALLPKIQF